MRQSVFFVVLVSGLALQPPTAPARPPAGHVYQAHAAHALAGQMQQQHAMAMHQHHQMLQMHQAYLLHAHRQSLAQPVQSSVAAHGSSAYAAQGHPGSAWHAKSFSRQASYPGGSYGGAGSGGGASVGRRYSRASSRAMTGPYGETKAACACSCSSTSSGPASPPFLQRTTPTPTGNPGLTFNSPLSSPRPRQSQPGLPLFRTPFPPLTPLSGTTGYPSLQNPARFAIPILIGSPGPLNSPLAIPIDLGVFLSPPASSPVAPFESLPRPLTSNGYGDFPAGTSVPAVGLPEGLEKTPGSFPGTSDAVRSRHPPPASLTELGMGIHARDPLTSVGQPPIRDALASLATPP